MKQHTKFIILISVFITSCNTSLDHDIDNGINYKMYGSTNYFKSIYYAKDHKYTGNIYQFYSDGMIHSITIVGDPNSKTYIYCADGNLSCIRKIFQSKKVKNQINYHYQSIDSTFECFTHSGKLDVYIKQKRIPFKIPLSEKSIHPADFIFNVRNGIIYINYIDEDGRMKLLNSIII